MDPFVVPDDKHDEESKPLITCIAEVGFLFIIASLAVIGNIVNFVVIGSSKSLKTCQGYFLLSLATADFGMGLVTLSAIVPAVIHRWPYGDTCCLIIAYMSEVCSRVSLITIISLSIERYIAVIHPFRYQRYVTKRKIAVIIVSTWLFCIAFFSQLFTRLYGLNYEFDVDKLVCSADYEDNMTYFIVALSLLLVPSFVVITFTSISVHIRVLKSSHRREVLFGRSSSVAMVPHRLPTHFRRNFKAFKLLVIIAGVYYITWLPYTILASLLTTVISHTTLPTFVEFLTYWLTISSSGFNVFVYFVMNQNYRRRAKDLWLRFRVSCRQWCCPTKWDCNTLPKRLADAHSFPSTASANHRFYIGIRRSDGNVMPTDVRVDSGRFSDECLNDFVLIPTDEHLFSIKSLKRMRSEPMRKRSVGQPTFSLKIDALVPSVQPSFEPTTA
ncbi:probable G-protein coupled receptor 21 [Diadema antillarum]|uniref:probable G-protein coupled receptor 21 n=1 Tax=Diadema antillarum TaxID=105358 RepID=UPI003A861B0C